MESKAHGAGPVPGGFSRLAAVALLLEIALCQVARAQTFDRGRAIDLTLAEEAKTQVFALADVNGDGFPDIVAVGPNADDEPAVIVLLNDRGGGFGGPVYFIDEEADELGEPVAVAVADVGSPSGSDSLGNADGKLDIIVLDAFSEAVIVLWGDGTGGFELSLDAERFGLTDLLEGEPVGLAIGDFDREHQRDVVVLDSGNGESRLLFLCNQPRAPFLSCETNAMEAGGEEPFAVATGDFDASGTTDVIVLNSAPNNGNLVLFNGNGRGRFTRSSGPPLALGKPSVTAITVARVDAGNTDDVVVSYIEEFGGDSIQVFLGGARLNPPRDSFAPGVAFAPVALAVGDFNGDGISDLVAAQDSPHSESFVMLGNGGPMGWFQGCCSSAGTLQGAGISVKVADLDRDGDDDFVVAREDRSGFRIALNARIRGTPSPTFTGPTFTPTPTPTPRPPTPTQTPTPIPTVPFDACPIQVGGMPVALAAAHLDPDLNFDLVVADGTGRLISLLPKPRDIRNTSCRDLSPFFTRRDTLLPGQPSAIAVGNLDRGLVADDVAVAMGETILLLYNNGGGFTVHPTSLTLPPPPTPGPPRSVAAIVIFDLNDDGAPDIITANQGRPVLTIFPGQREGGFEDGRPLDVSGTGAAAVIVTHIDDRQRLPDLVAIVNSGQTTQIVGFRQSAPLTFTLVSLIGAGALGGAATAIVAEDFNGDMIQDLGITVRTGSGRGKFVMFTGSGDSRFGNPVEVTGTATTPIQNPVALAVGDFELQGGRLDGNKDVVVADDASPQGRLFFLQGDGQGRFTALEPIATASGVVSLAVADVDGDEDGRDDVAVAHSSGSLSLVRSSQPFPTFTPTQTPTPTSTRTRGSPTPTQPSPTPEPPPPGTSTPTGTPKLGAFTLSDGCVIDGGGARSGTPMLWGGLLIWLARRRVRRTDVRDTF